MVAGGIDNGPMMGWTIYHHAIRVDMQYFVDNSLKLESISELKERYKLFYAMHVLHSGVCNITYSLPYVHVKFTCCPSVQYYAITAVCIWYLPNSYVCLFTKVEEKVIFPLVAKKLASLNENGEYNLFVDEHEVRKRRW